MAVLPEPERIDFDPETGERDSDHEVRLRASDPDLLRPGEGPTAQQSTRFLAYAVQNLPLSDAERRHIVEAMLRELDQNPRGSVRIQAARVALLARSQAESERWHQAQERTTTDRTQVEAMKALLASLSPAERAQLDALTLRGPTPTPTPRLDTDPAGTVGCKHPTVPAGSVVQDATSDTVHPPPPGGFITGAEAQEGVQPLSAAPENQNHPAGMAEPPVAATGIQDPPAIPTPPTGVTENQNPPASEAEDG